MKTDTIAIRVENLYAGYNNIPIIEDINFDVLKGEIFVILGGSGCGKSTLLKHMIGLLPPISGNVFILDKNLCTAQGQEKTQILQPEPPDYMRNTSRIWE